MMARGGAVASMPASPQQHMAVARLLFAKSKDAKNPQPFLKAAAQFKTLARAAAGAGGPRNAQPQPITPGVDPGGPPAMPIGMAAGLARQGAVRMPRMP